MVAPAAYQKGPEIPFLYLRGTIWHTAFSIFISCSCLKSVGMWVEYVHSHACMRSRTPSCKATRVA